MYDSNAFGADLEPHAPAERSNVWHTHRSTVLVDTLSATGMQASPTVSVVSTARGPTSRRRLKRRRDVGAVVV